MPRSSRTTSGSSPPCAGRVRGGRGGGAVRRRALACVLACSQLRLAVARRGLSSTSLSSALLVAALLAAALLVALLAALLAAALLVALLASWTSPRTRGRCSLSRVSCGSSRSRRSLFLSLRLLQSVPPLLPLGLTRARLRVSRRLLV